jgi:hypothetical protein
MVEKRPLPWNLRRALLLLGLFLGVVMLGTVPTLLQRFKTHLQLSMDASALWKSLGRILPAEPVFFTVEGHRAFLFLPKADKRSDPQPWVWFSPTVGRSPGEAQAWIFSHLLREGIAIGGVDVGESYGSPAGVAVYSAFYEEAIRRFHLARRVVLLPQSRGGLMSYNWARHNAEKVAGVAAIYPMVNALSSEKGIRVLAKAHGLSREAFLQDANARNPLEGLEPLARAGVPIVHILGDADPMASFEKHSGELQKRYEALGGSVRIILIPGVGHEVSPLILENEEFIQSVIQMAATSTMSGK